ncbi:class A beta-lactamase [Inhella proteolytica]|uniref:Beta-lactamase n=1 Tax=Inhella proteolytica TaxID=2795029 RepID=A0A931J4T8_9BURK|nr:class A beta-lactamase [Inhella proteolytica]MBH9578230.1 class A beta-lactamase [Inhella proteolytica]
MPNLSRRHLLALAAALPLPALALSSPELSQALAALEARAGGRLGVAVLDSGSGAQAGHRANERFGLCSTFKLLLAGAVLQRIDAGRWPAERAIRFGKADLVSHAPVVRAHLAQGRLSAVELAEATQTTSDNAAANLLLRELFGGPSGLTDWLRERGDTVTRLDRWEPEMSRLPPGELRDTSTPAAIAASAARLLTGDWLQAASRTRLIAWMEATQTGTYRLRAGLPKGWRAGDKTGTGLHPSMQDLTNDVAIVWPGPDRAPWLIAAYYEGPRRSRDIQAADEAVLAEVGRLVGRWQPG